MLSPGQWYKHVPKDYFANIKFRKAVLERCVWDMDFRKGIQEICSKDILFWINTFVWQFNPKTKDHTKKKGPFVTYDFQDVAIVGGDTVIGGEKRFQHGLLKCIEDQVDVRWPKSREIGASWLVLMTSVWLCMYKDAIKVLVMSKDEAAVDSLENSDSLFWKIRQILDHLPDWMRGEIYDKKTSISFKSTGNMITGEANAESSGVGGRATFAFIDEFGQYDKNGQAIYDFTTDTTDCRIFVFTHKNTSGMAYSLCYDKKFADMREILVHWSQHPEKNQGLYRYDENLHQVIILDPNFHTGEYGFPPDFEFVMRYEPAGGPCPGIRSPWYDKECKRRTERDIQMNLDIDPRGASDRFFDTYRVKLIKAESCRPPLWRGNLEYDKKRGVPIRLVEQGDGPLKLWVLPKNDREMPRMAAGAGVDVASGTGETPSCLSVINAETGEKFAEFDKADIYAHDFAAFCAAFLRMIKDHRGTHPLLVWELQGSGVYAKVIQEDCHYSPFWIRRDEDVPWRQRDGKMRAGWIPHPKPVLTLMEIYRTALYEGLCINPSEYAIDETLNFVYTDTSVEYKKSGTRKKDGTGARVHHGDIVRADALAYMMVRELGYGQSRVEQVIERQEIDLRTFDGRMKMAELLAAEEENEVWR